MKQKQTDIARRLVAVVATVLCGTMCIAIPMRLYSQDAVYASEEHRFRVERIVSGLHNPWSIAVLPDGDLLISERPGSLWRISNGTKTQIKGLPPIAAVGQGGLLDIELARDFRTSRQLFFSYSAEVGRSSYATTIAKANLRSDRLESVQTIFVANNPHASGIHFGSRISQLADGTLVFSIGDRGRRNDAQNTAVHAGSLLRIDTNGNPPADNPFIDDPRYAPELYSIGHRNIQGLAVAADGSLFAHEHGPMGGDEVNLIVRGGGGNYGWPIITFGREYRTNKKIGRGVSAPGYEQPLLHWSPSIAPSGMMIYSGKRFPRWQGNIFVGALAGEHIVRLTYRGNGIMNTERLLTKSFGRIRDIKEDNDGDIYFITDSRRGAIYRIALP